MNFLNVEMGTKNGYLYIDRYTFKIKFMIRKSFILFGSGILWSLVLLTGFGSSYAQITGDNIGESITSYFDEFSYLCLNIESLGGLDEENDQVDEKTKQDCKKQLESIDIIKEKELIQKYGELDE